MPRRTRRPTDQDPIDINLAPILNLVIILIPLLLLSVVFEQMGVVDVEVPKLCACGKSFDGEPQVPTPTLQLEPNHFKLTTPVVLEPTALPNSCTQSSDGITCTLQDPSLEQTLHTLRAQQYTYARTRARAHHLHVENTMNHALAQYDWHTVYNVLHAWKQSAPQVDHLMLVSHEALPFEFVTRAMDIARTQRKSAHPRGYFEDARALNIAPYALDASGQSKAMFRTVTLGIAH